MAERDKGIFRPQPVDVLDLCFLNDRFAFFDLREEKDDFFDAAFRRGIMDRSTEARNEGSDLKARFFF